ncbi:MAG: PVC-type heme-binding CxxCH protein [Limisphaerales bacterium]
MKHILLTYLAILVLPLVTFSATPAPPPKAPNVPSDLSAKIEALQPGVKLTLLAEHPALVTPIGIDVDAKGSIYLVASHTHHRPQGYAGPEHDEVLVFDLEGNRRRVFYNKTDRTMHVKVGPDGWLYLAERSRVLRVKDTNSDGVGDVEENLATLDTVSDYPHNGLSGMAWHPDGGLVFSLGENFGKDWTLTSKDGVKLTGRGEGGVFRCNADGTRLRRIARGFWNPFGLWVREDGEIFAVENDPGSRPPCRLLNIVEGADYGFQWVYGSAPVHPFVAWNGELRGTLPMIHPSGEAPCALVPMGGGVMVPSWSEHRIDYFPLVRKGAGYTSQRTELLRGGENFRPTCIAKGPDGAFYMTDWVFSSYELHGRGRLWKLEIDQGRATWIKKTTDPLNAAARLAKELREGKAKLSTQQLFEHARGSDAYLSDAALTALARASAKWTPASVRALPDRDRVWALVALRRVDLKEEKWVGALLHDPDPEVRFECLRWIADAVLTRFGPDVEKMLGGPELDYRLFEAVLATWNTLRGNPGAGVTDTAVLMERVTNAATPARLKGFALRLVPASHPKLTVPMLRDLLAANDPVLSLECVRTLVARTADDAQAVLAGVAADEARDAQLRAEAVVGLSMSSTPGHHALLIKLAAHDNAAVRNEALRALRLSALDDADRKAITETARRHPESASLATALLVPASINARRPASEDTAAWLKRLAALPGKPDAAAGRRIFFHPRMAMCATCHRHSGRGNVVGPDLSLVAQQGDEKALLKSILEPNREVAPQFFPTVVELKDGTEFTGIMLRAWSKEVYRDLTGKERTFEIADIVRRTEMKTSLMPSGLPESITDEELRDLIAFLRGVTSR